MKLSKSKQASQLDYVEKLESFKGGSKAEIKWVDMRWCGWINGTLVVETAGISDAVEQVLETASTDNWYYTIVGQKIRFSSRPNEKET